MSVKRLYLAFCLISITLPVFGQASEANIEQARSVLREGVNNNDPLVKVQAIQSAGLIGQNETLRKRLETMLDDSNVDVRVAAINTLTDLKSTASIPALKQRLNEDKAPEVAFAAAKALYALHDPAGKEGLYDVYTKKRKASSDMLHSKTRSVLNNLHSFSSASTFIVSQGIGYVPVPGVGEGFSAVTGLLSDPELSPRAVSLLLLAHEKSDWSSELLKNALADDEWSVRAAAAQMIAYGARADLRDDLVPLFSDKTAKVRFRAAGAYLHLALVDRSKATKQNAMP